jgi:hypothetical protein
MITSPYLSQNMQILFFRFKSSLSTWLVLNSPLLSPTKTSQDKDYVIHTKPHSFMLTLTIFVLD